MDKYVIKFQAVINSVKKNKTVNEGVNENLRVSNQAVQTTATEANRTVINSNWKLYGFMFNLHTSYKYLLSLDAIHCCRSRIP